MIRLRELIQDRGQQVDGFLGIRLLGPVAAAPLCIYAVYLDVISNRVNIT